MQSPHLKQKLSERIYKTSIKDLYFIEHKCHTDERGSYCELDLIPEIEEAAGHSFNIRQINYSYSEQNVIRGFHAENWNKLATVIHGVAHCVLLDIRPESPTFRQTAEFRLGNEEGALNGSIFISKGIANSFLVIKGPVKYLYGVDQLYAERDKGGDAAISLFDPEINIEWPISSEEMVISERDLSAVNLAEYLASKS